MLGLKCRSSCLTFKTSPELYIKTVDIYGRNPTLPSSSGINPAELELIPAVSVWRLTGLIIFTFRSECHPEETSNVQITFLLKSRSLYHEREPF